MKRIAYVLLVIISFITITAYAEDKKPSVSRANQQPSAQQQSTPSSTPRPSRCPLIATSTRPLGVCSKPGSWTRHTG